MKIKPVATSAWIDGYSLGFKGRCSGFFDRGEKSLNEALEKIGGITTPKTKDYDGYEQFTLDLFTDDEREAGNLRVDLHARREEADLVFSERCTISGNGMTMMRGDLGHTACGGLSFDGKANILGRQHMQLEPLERQLPLLIEAFEFARDALATAFPGWVPEALWLKRAEACRDLPIENAIAAVRIIQHSTLCGATQRRVDEYRRIGDEEVRGIPAIRYIQQAVGPEDKIYAKRDHDLRLEIACRDRTAVTRLTGTERAAFNSDGVRSLYLNFLAAATPRLDRLEEHAREAMGSEISVANLIVALKPLIDRAAGEQKPKGPASNQGQADALRLLDALLSIGMCDAFDTHSRHAIRHDLEALCGEHGPLIRHPSRAIYNLKPKFARACGIIRLSEAAIETTVQL